ncbi:hypothetical protein MNBD_GAMMA21-2319 [hydrothermal vent metagenome]|uniref:Antibiotic biosynthesis monooxygenase n=1 Tax=hydrothermal vent metagenome TaxID=652676 RepID=A0A3B1ANF7_9ZZZZ
MYAVIFTAERLVLDDEYNQTAEKMRTLAFEKYNCVDFQSLREGDKEITISYWKNLDDIHAWKQDKEHIQAQQSGRDKWYRHYDVKIVEILREYQEKRGSETEKRGSETY